MLKNLAYIITIVLMSISALLVDSKLNELEGRVSELEQNINNVQRPVIIEVEPEAFPEPTPGPAPMPKPEDVLGATCTNDNGALYDMINAARASAGKRTLSPVTELYQSAQWKAGDVYSRGYWSHITPEGETPFATIARFGYSYIHSGENLARGYNCDEQRMAAWLKSPSHRANLLNGTWNDVGIGRVGNVVTVHFGLR